MDAEILILVTDSEGVGALAERVFDEFVMYWTPQLPTSSDIQHIGATAISGCLTKGDLDICIRIDQVDFENAKQSLLARYRHNHGSVTRPTFISFHDETSIPPLGIQLVVKESELDIFVMFRDCLCADPRLVERYNAIKQKWKGRGMEAYRSEKSGFIEEIIG